MFALFSHTKPKNLNFGGPGEVSEISVANPIERKSIVGFELKKKVSFWDKSKFHKGSIFVLVHGWIL